MSIKKKLVIGLFLFACLALSLISALDGGDFDVYLDAGRKILNGDNIYAPPFVKGLQYYYSPLFALILAPIAWLEIDFVVEFIWLILSWVMLWRIWKLIGQYFNIETLSERQYYWWFAISLFFSLRFILYNISMIQVTIFLLWMLMEGYRMIREGEDWKGAFLLALIINIKLMPLVVVPYLLYRGYFKAVSYIVVFSVVFLYLPGLFIGFEYNNYLNQEWWKIINPSNTEHVLESEITYQSIVGTIPVFITETELMFGLKRNFLNLPVDTVIWITNLCRLFVAGLTLYFLGKPFQKKADGISEIWSFSFLLMNIPLIFPHQQKYAFLFFLPAVSYLAYFMIRMYAQNPSIKTKMFILIFGMVSLIFSPLIGSDILGRETYDLLQYYRILGIAALLYVPMMVWAKPSLLSIK